MRRLPVQSLTAGIILTLGLLRAPSIATAQGITVSESRVSYSFAQQITFTLQAASDAEITTVYLFFRAIGGEQTESVLVDLTQGREINVNYTHDLRYSPLPPFATVEFWWRIEDAAGHSLSTDHQQFKYIDNRFQWDTCNAAGITVHWMQGHGDPVFCQTALDIAQVSAAEISAELDIPVPESITIYIYDAQYNLDAAMVLTGREWAGAQARPELGVIVVAIPFEGDLVTSYKSRMMRYIPHEITHLLVYQAVTPTSYRYVPEWLDEGLATANERLPTPEYAIMLEEARTAGQLLPLEDLCDPFAPDPQTAFLAYAQSGSIVRFIRERYGAAGIRALLQTYANGASCAGGVQEALGTSLSGLETEWRVSLEPEATWRTRIEQIDVWIGLWLLGLLLAVPMIGGLRRRR